MRWNRISEYAHRSDCRRYTVCVVSLMGVGRHEAWHGKELLHTDPDAQVCRDACAKHAGLGPVETDLRAIAKSRDDR